MNTLVVNDTHFNLSQIFEDNSTDTSYLIIEDTIYLDWLLVYMVSIVLASALSLVTFIVALISWILIPKWRTFKNYVFLNLILTYTSLYTVFFIEKIREHFLFIAYFCVCSFGCWMFVASVVSYMDIVKVFSTNISHRKIKCALFGWGVPLISLLSIFIGSLCFDYALLKSPGYFSFHFVVLLLFCNFLIYVRVMFSLFHKTRYVSRTRFMQKMQVATFTFLMSGSMTLPAILLEEFGVNIVTSFMCGLIPLLQTVFINVCFLMLKSNRAMWREACCASKRARYNNSS